MNKIIKQIQGNIIRNAESGYQEASTCATVGARKVPSGIFCVPSHYLHNIILLLKDTSNQQLVSNLRKLIPSFLEKRNIHIYFIIIRKIDP